MRKLLAVLVLAVALPLLASCGQQAMPAAAPIQPTAPEIGSSPSPFSESTPTAVPREEAVYAKSVNVDISIQENGDFEVIETREIAFPSSQEFKHGFREIPLALVEEIGAVEVSENGQKYESGRDRPYTYDVAKTSDNLRIDWWYPPTSGETRTFSVKYVVTGGLYIYDAGDQLYWKVIESDRDYPINASVVTVHLPEALAPSELRIASYETKAKSQIIDSRTVRFSTGEIVAGRGLEIRVQFPHGIVPNHVPEWQKASDHNSPQES